MNTTVGVLGAVGLAWAGIQLGTLWIMKLAILPMLNTMPYERYVNSCQLIDMHVFHPIAVWGGVVVAAIGVAAAFQSTSTVMAVLFVIGSVAMVTVGFTSEVFNRPTWRRIELWSPLRAPEGWQRTRVNWDTAHQVRTYAAVGAVGAYAAAVITGIA
ncbi:MAG TPA: hypothetical protein VHX38_31285 [Pseudonocardiaceae bacterium]|jgi:hypothetical protein|nr:hypothetical protein [Pseudonocardiaceae bacterium]